MVGKFFLAVLNGNLHVIKAGIGECPHCLRREANGRGDEITVETGLSCRRHDVLQVAPRRWLAAGKMHLQYAETGCFTEHARPGDGVEFVRALDERERVRAIGTAERAAVSQLGQQAKGGRQRVRRRHS
jgi:hypothetical protein